LKSDETRKVFDWRDERRNENENKSSTSFPFQDRDLIRLEPILMGYGWQNKHFQPKLVLSFFSRQYCSKQFRKKLAQKLNFNSKSLNGSKNNSKNRLPLL